MGFTPNGAGSDMSRKSMFLWGGLTVVAGLGGLVTAFGQGWFGAHEGPGKITGAAVPVVALESRQILQSTARDAIGAQSAKQILFGDLHVHTTISSDAFFYTLAFFGGDGGHPQADACDFARYCSALDFWSINDHAYAITPRKWDETVQSIRQCNAVAGDAANPDIVAFLGWEWTQRGNLPKDHYGHKNIILRDLEDDKIPDRPVFAGEFGNLYPKWDFKQRVLASAFGGDPRLDDMNKAILEVQGTPVCPTGVDVHDLQKGCVDSAATPEELFRKLDEWGSASIVIPHGTAWGWIAPPFASWDNQLDAGNHDPKRQTMIEIYSGHGNSEEYRPYRAYGMDESGTAFCPKPTATVTPTCWQAGEIIRTRCMTLGETPETCHVRAVKARNLAAQFGLIGHNVVGGYAAEEWLDAGQCKDCFLPTFNHRPASSAQYALALRNFDDPDNPLGYEFGIMASSDNHSARPGTGYKEFARRTMTDAIGPEPKERVISLEGEVQERLTTAEPVDLSKLNLLGILESERSSSFLLTGGLIAAHSMGRDRAAIWDALDQKQVYGTSGSRILLWFDLINGPGESVRPMGSKVEMEEVPRFEVRAIGSFKQKPGCPDYATNALSPERLEHLCRGECYNPSDQRKLITRIEIVRIRPQSYAGEPIVNLIDDAWKVFPCPPDEAGCTVQFSDEEYLTNGRDALYYARAIEEESDAVNGGQLRCTRDEDGNCISIDVCYGGARGTPSDDDCLTPTEERAWSSPIFVDYAAAD